jgi:transmembrane sensor
VTATALGTGFDVRRIGNTIRVDVGHGRVRVARDERDTAAPVLTAGQWISFTPGHRPETGSEQVALLGAWPSGELVARECTIAEVIDKLRPWYGGRILLLDHAIGQRRVSGFYNAHDPIDALRTIVHPHGGTVTRVTPWLLIISS